MNGPRVPAVAEGMAYAVLRMALILCVLAGATTIAVARTAPGALPEMALAALPREAQEVYALIGRGGPFHYDRDGVVFGNREGLLPERPRGYYREYTVRTPGVKSRGARRLICGGPARTPDACFYTDDHYQSFRRIRP
jgi:ribonuclease T1